MQYLYIDESGTMTTGEHVESFPYFVICILKVTNRDKLKKVIKRFISSHMTELKALNDGKMFIDDKFIELKGASLTRDLKMEFANYLCKSDLFEIYYIVVDNKRINPKTYNNKARAFNFLIDRCLTFLLNHHDLPYDDYNIQIDERNVKTNAQKTLEDYLATELGLHHELINDVKVSYCDSCNNSFIQLSDFFANLYYSYLRRKKQYKELIEDMISKGIIKNIFVFPDNLKNKSYTNNVKTVNPE